MRSPGDSDVTGRVDVVGAEAELGQELAGLVRRPAARWRPGRRRSSGRRRLASRSARAWSISPTTTPGPDPLAARGQRDPAEQGADEGGLPRAVGPEDGHPFTPADLDVDRPEPEGAPVHHGAPPGGR